jgi:hypothetical protein
MKGEKNKTEIINAIMEQRAYMESIKFANDKGWKDIVDAQKSGLGTIPIIPSKYEKYIKY